MAAEWSRVVNTTIHEYVRDVEVNILRNRKLLAMLMNRGRITFNHAGDLMDWKVRYKRAPMQGYADSDTLTFSRRDRWKTAQLGWRGYASTDSMTKMERLKNKNVEAIIKVYSEIASNLMDDIEDQFCDELYIDGEASGNEKRIHGIESFMSTSGAAAGGFIGSPNDTYAGLVCTLGNYGGNWSTDAGSNIAWPSGVGDSNYDFWAPLIVDYTDTAWTAATKTWVNTAVEALRYGIMKGQKNKSKKGQLDLILLDNELYRGFIALMAAEERLVVDRGTRKGGLIALGFEDTVNLDGVDISYEYGIPYDSAGYPQGYGWSLDNMELCSLQAQMFVPEGPDFDIATQSYRFSIDFFGNAKHNPRNFTKWKKIT